MSAAAGRRALALLGPFVGLALIVGLFHALAPDHFLQPDNLQTILSQSVLVTVAALGMTFVIIAGGIDLSVGSVMALSSVVTAKCLVAGLSPLLALLAGVAAGSICGAASGALITGLRIVPFVITLGMLGVARGLAKLLCDQRPVNPDDPGWLRGLMVARPDPPWLLVSPGVWLAFALAVASAIVLRLTRFGLHVYAIGSNEATARLCGVRVAATKIRIYALGGAFTGLSGALLFADLTQGDPTAALGKELEVIAAVVIGGGSLSGGEGRVVGTVVGALIMASLANGCTLVGVENYVQEILIGAIIVAAVALDRLR